MTVQDPQIIADEQSEQPESQTVQAKPKRRRKAAEEDFYTPLLHNAGSVLRLDLIAAVVLSECVKWDNVCRKNPKRRGWFYHSESDWLEISPTLTQQAIRGRKRKGTKDSKGALTRIQEAYESAVPDHLRYGPVLEVTTDRPEEFKERLKPGKRTYYRLNTHALNAWFDKVKRGREEGQAMQNGEADD